MLEPSIIITLAAIAIMAAAVRSGFKFLTLLERSATLKLWRALVAATVCFL